jgi:stage II sporulation protein P
MARVRGTYPDRGGGRLRRPVWVRVGAGRGRRRPTGAWRAHPRRREAALVGAVAAAVAALALSVPAAIPPRLGSGSWALPATARIGAQQPDGRLLALVESGLPALALATAPTPRPSLWLWLADAAAGLAGAGAGVRPFAGSSGAAGPVASASSSGTAPYPPSAAHPPNAVPPYPAPPPPDVYGDRPLVAIYHTDSTEAYLPAMRAAGLPLTAPFSADQAVGVVQVGAVLARALARLGVGAVHSRAVNDPDGPIGAYENSLRTALALMRAYPAVRILLDVHRAGPGEADAGLPPPAAAGVALVVGTDDRLPEPHWRQNLAFAHVIAAAAARLYPDWPVRVVVSPNEYNQEISPGALLVQVGTSATTLAQADEAARRLARVLAAVIEGGLYPGAPESR